MVHFGSSLSIASPSLTAVALPTAPAARRLRPVDGVAFLPAALEIVETPPSPIGRAIALTVIAAFCAALAWASLGKVDIIAAAQGKIIPSGRSKIVQPFEIGAVRAIHVKDGQTVKAGDVLIELDPTISDAELRHLRSDLVAAQLDVARLRAALADGDPLAAFDPPDGAPAGLLATERQRCSIRPPSSVPSSPPSIGSGCSARPSGRPAATIAKIEAMIPMLEERVDIRGYLMEQERPGRRSSISRIEPAGRAAEGARRAAEPSARGRSRAAGRRRAASAGGRGISPHSTRRAGDRGGQGGGPRSGCRQGVKELPAENSPSTGRRHRAAARRAHRRRRRRRCSRGCRSTAGSRSRRWCRTTMSALSAPGRRPRSRSTPSISPNTGNFTKYGLLHGSVLNVSKDAIDQRKPPTDSGNTAKPNTDSASEPPGHEPVYAAHVSLDRTAMEIDGKEVPLSPGMAVTVGIKTGAQRIITYLMSPLLRFKQEALDER